MAAWEQLLEELAMTRHRELTAYAPMLTERRSDAEDLVQDALIATFGSRRSIPNAIAAETYVRRAIASKFIDTKRRGSVERRVLRKVGANDTDLRATPDTVAEHSTDVGRALTHLTPRERSCVVLRYIEHYSVRETGEALGLSEGAVKRYVSDGIGKLNALLGTEADPDLVEFAAVEAKR